MLEMTLFFAHRTNRQIPEHQNSMTASLKGRRRPLGVLAQHANRAWYLNRYVVINDYRNPN